jgi:hypothetical protein
MLVMRCIIVRSRWWIGFLELQYIQVPCVDVEIEHLPATFYVHGAGDIHCLNELTALGKIQFPQLLQLRLEMQEIAAHG